MHDDETRPAGVDPASGYGAVVSRFLAILISLGVMHSFDASDRRDLGANQCVINDIQPEQRYAGVVATALEISVDERVGEAASLRGPRGP